MGAGNRRDYIEKVLKNMPDGWLRLTTHRLDVYNEEQAKTQFLDHFAALFNANDASKKALGKLPTAYDYIRLGHPLSCVLEWTIAHDNGLKPENVISFSSKTIAILAILRKNLLAQKATQILHSDTLPPSFEADVLRQVYGYRFELKQIEKGAAIPPFNGSTILVSEKDAIAVTNFPENVDYLVNVHPHFGSVLLIGADQHANDVSQIQHVRRRETIAMTPSHCLAALNSLVMGSTFEDDGESVETNKTAVFNAIKSITAVDTKPLVASSGLSMQYAIMMGLVHDAIQNHKGKDIKFIVPPNCYGGTNDQARRVAACSDAIEIVDLPVDGANDMARSIDLVLEKVAREDAVPYIIAEIPTNPRVEVPDLQQLKQALQKERKTAAGETAIDPVFILDQTFCPNTHFLGEGDILSTVRSISYVSGSKFPSGGLCTAGYCIANKKAAALMEKIALHLSLCDNGATNLQMTVLAKQLPSMNARIKQAYANTREFVDFIGNTLPAAKINFVSTALAEQGFTPSVFSLDLPTKGNTAEEKEAYKRALNLKLIKLMIAEIPDESKYCVSYGQLKGCYWTIPATSTQGTTKEGDKDYIARVALAPVVDLERHKKVFLEFVEEI